MGRYEAARTIGEWDDRRGKYGHVPIVALTANGQESDREKCRAAGLHDYMTQSISRDKLGKMISSWMKFDTADVSGNKCAESERGGEAKPGRAADLDQNALQNIRALQRPDAPDLLAKITNIYFDKSPGLIGQLHRAMEKGDAQLLRNSAHSLKSSSANLGALKLADLCAKLETMGKTGQLEEAASTLEILEFEYESVCKALHGEIHRETC